MTTLPIVFSGAGIGRLHIKSWCADVEEGAMQQAINLANHPATFHHVALMPDCHQGYGMPIGGVIAVRNAVIPNAVGVDIGCGMCAVKTTARAAEVSRDQVAAIILRLSELVPVGFAHHEQPQDWDGFADAPDIRIVREQIEPARRQLGTLGGGNHFAEVQAGDDGFIWLMLHSGSRNFGYRIAKTYNNTAMKLCKRWHSALPPGKGEDGLAFLPIGSPEAAEYVKAMNYAMRFAARNRAVMMLMFKAVVWDELACEFDNEVNIHHNFAAIEHHFGEDVWVHRKGATKAMGGQLGIIPGSMGTASYIVMGRGAQDSFMSCSHGAGRRMGRAEFCRQNTVEDADASLGDVVFLGWGRDRKGNPDISEAPGAYKDINQVIEAQRDLVDVVARLRPLGVLKG